jgi:hypothetical protein
VRYWFNDVATELGVEETLWVSGSEYANNGDNWEMPGEGETSMGYGKEEDAENMGGMQGLSMKGKEIDMAFWGGFCRGFLCFFQWMAIRW